MNKQLIYLILICLSLSGAVPAWAVRVKNLYSASVPVKNQSANVRQQAIVTAFKRVLVKLSGNTEVTQRAEIQPVLADAEAYLQQYSYAHSTGSNGKLALVLQARFNPKAVKQLLQNAGQPIWGQNRPQVLLWLIQQDPQNPSGVRFVNQASPIQQLAAKLAKQYGIPLILPLLDIQDLAHVSALSLWNGQYGNIAQEIARYGSDAALIVKVNQSNKLWQGQWTLFLNQQQITWQTTGRMLMNMLAQGMDTLTDKLAANYSVSVGPKDKQQVILTISGVHDIAAYAKVTAYLKNLAPVKHVSVVNVAADYLVFKIKIIGGEAALVRAIRLDHALQAVSTANNQPGLHYQWLA